MALKRVVLTVAMGLMLVASAAPASASAETKLLHEGEPIAEGGVTETFSGTFAMENEAGGISCESSALTITFTWTNAHITSWFLSGCKTTGVLPLLGCQIKGNPIATSLPWTVDYIPPFRITGTRFRFLMGPGCAIGNEIATEGEIDATPDNLAAIGSVSLSGAVSTTVGEQEVSGTMTAANPGTFEFE